MPVTTTDELRAHRFLSRRLSAALLDGDAESTVRPLTRLGIGTYAGIFLTVVLLAIVGIAGVLRPGGSTAWSEPGAFVVERETGARYVYLDGVLHPVLNYASARLLLGEALHVVTVSGRSLETAPRGPVIGIPGASDSLPDRSHIVGTDWSVCAIGDAANPQPYRTTVYPGRATAGEALDGQAGYLLRTTAGRFLLLWSGHAHPVSDQWLPALGYRTATAVTVQDDFAAALPSGQLLAPPAIAGIGQPGPALPGSVAPVAVGSIFADRTNAYYLMTQGGLAALTPCRPGCCWPIRGSSRPMGEATQRRCRSARRRSPTRQRRPYRTRDPARPRRPRFRNWSRCPPVSSNSASGTEIGRAATSWSDPPTRRPLRPTDWYSCQSATAPWSRPSRRRLFRGQRCR